MATKENAKNVLAELQDLSDELREMAIGKEGVFYRYRPKGRIGASILKELKKKYERARNRFVFSDDIPESGILSICQGLLTVITTVEKMDADPKGEYTDMITELIEQLLKAVEAPNGKGYILDASPLIREAEIFREHVYLDSATWVISTILGIVRLRIAGKYPLNEVLRDKLIDLYKFCLDTINKAYIANDSTTRKFNRGWNFTDGCEEPSIYFTFAVSEVLIDILSTFENVIRSADVSLIQEAIYDELDPEGFFKTPKFKEYVDRIEAKLIETATSDAENIENALEDAQFHIFSKEEKQLIIEMWQKRRAIDAECAVFTEKIKSNTREIKSECKFFEHLNSGFAPYDENSPYRILEDHCKESANNIWELTKDQIADSFFAGNLESTISKETIESCVSSDAIFNVILAINIIINTGLDEDAEDKINYFTRNGSKEYDDAIVTYDNMRDALRLAYDNCYQFFVSIRKKNKQYKINEYSLNFDETFKTHQAYIGQLRRAHIRTFSLMPLLVRTKLTMGEFLIRYPQYDMQLFLEQILQYRSVNKENKYIWLWEKVAYSAASNYYFISSLASFYDYYETYEEAFLAHANDNQAAKKRIETEYHAALLEQGKAADKNLAEFEEQEKKISDLEAHIASLDEEITSYRNDPLRSALSGFVTSVLKEMILNVLAEQFSAEAARIVTSKRESVEKRAEQYKEEMGTDENVPLSSWEEVPSRPDGIEKGMSDMLLALFAERFGEAVYSVKPSAETRAKALDRLDDFDKFARLAGKDFRQAMRFYLRGLAENNKSDFVANCGESTLPNGEHRFLEDLIEEKKTSKGDKK